VYSLLSSYRQLALLYCVLLLVIWFSGSFRITVSQRHSRLHSLPLALWLSSHYGTPAIEATRRRVAFRMCLTNSMSRPSIVGTPAVGFIPAFSHHSCNRLLDALGGGFFCSCHSSFVVNSPLLRLALSWPWCLGLLTTRSVVSFLHVGRLLLSTSSVDRDLTISQSSCYH
jgi:hypothetical protein